MIKNIVMPSGGQTTDRSMVTRWLVEKDEKVKRGDILLEIETDKATMSVESFTKGIILDILVEEGEYASAGEVLALVGDENDKSLLQKNNEPIAEKEMDTKEQINSEEYDEYQSIAKNEFTSEFRNHEVEKSIPHDTSKIKAMPNAKKLAKEKGISLEHVAAYVETSFVKLDDVERYIRNDTTDKDASKKIIPLTGMRNVIAKRMLESSQTIPVFHATINVDMTSCIELRNAVNSAKNTIKVSFNDILCKCIATAISKYPLINSSFSNEGIVLYKDVNIGLAVSVEDGLVVPVCRNVGNLMISEISQINNENVKSAKSGKVKQGDMSGGTITLSNLGMYPIQSFTAIINPPEVCILAVGQIKMDSVYVDNGFKPVQTMSITGTFDHRVIDGAYGAEFLQELKHIVENPALMLV